MEIFLGVSTVICFVAIGVCGWVLRCNRLALRVTLAMIDAACSLKDRDNVALMRHLSETMPYELVLWRIATFRNPYKGLPIDLVEAAARGAKPWWENQAPVRF